jgi:hypothetical protein
LTIMPDRHDKFTIVSMAALAFPALMSTR